MNLVKADEPATFLITGTSGTGIGLSIARFLATHQEFSIVRLEDHLRLLARDELGTTAEPDMKEVFGLHELALRDLWPKALRSAADAARTSLRNGLDVLFVLHASWYHVEARSMFLPVSTIDLAAEDLGIAHVTTLIDDVYDGFVRLSGRDELFHPALSTSSLHPSTVLLKLLEWREFEVRESERLARDLNVRHFVFPVKTRSDNFRGLLTRQPEMLYISHPIRDVRSEDGEELKRFSHLIDDAARIVEQSGRVVIQPTSIDELRFPGREHYAAPLGLWPRWPTAPIDQMFWSPAGSLADPVDDFFSSVRMIEDADRWLEDNIDTVEALREEIWRHVTWRDRKLVEQSDGLVILDPFYSQKGTIAGSVRIEAELDVYFQVRSSDRPSAVLWHTEAAEARRRAGAVLTALRRNFHDIQGLREEDLPKLGEHLETSAMSWAIEQEEPLGAVLWRTIQDIAPMFQLLPGGADAHMGVGRKATRQAESKRMLGVMVKGQLEGGPHSWAPLPPVAISEIAESGRELGHLVVAQLSSRLRR